MQQAGEVRATDVRTIEAAVARLARVAYSHKARRRIEDRAGVPLPPNAIAVLAAVQSYGPVRLGAVARRLGLQASRVSKEVRTLVDAGYVEQTPDPDDRRAVLLVATDKGAEAYRRYRAAAEDALAEVLDSWSDAEVHRLARLVDRLAGGFAAPPAHAEGPPT
jgi:DNA-binding MarR family transcriptional regulator